MAAGCKEGRIGDVNRSDVAFNWSVQLQDKADFYSVFHIVITNPQKRENQLGNAFLPLWNMLGDCWLLNYNA